MGPLEHVPLLFDADMLCLVPLLLSPIFALYKVVAQTLTPRRRRRLVTTDASGPGIPLASRPR